MKLFRLSLALLSGLSAASPAIAQEPVPISQESVRVIGAKGDDSTVAPVQLSDVERYCGNIADPAREARTALQTERLNELQTQVDARIDELETKRAEYQAWIEERRAFLESTSSIMLDIYASMRPDAAAAQLAGIDREAAASIVAKLKARQASAILAEMPAPVAAELATMIVNRVERPEGVATDASKASS